MGYLPRQDMQALRKHRGTGLIFVEFTASSKVALVFDGRGNTLHIWALPLPALLPHG